MPSDETTPGGSGAEAVSEREVARFTVRDGVRLIPAAGAAIRESAVALGLSADDAEKLRAATEVMAREVAVQGFESPDAATFDVALVERPGEIAVSVPTRP